MPTVSFSGTQNLSGLGLSGSSFTIEFDCALQDLAGGTQGIFGSETGDLLTVGLDTTAESVFYYGEGNNAGFQTDSYGGFGWTAGEAVTVRISCVSNTLSVSFTDGSSNTASLSVSVTDITGSLSGATLMGDGTTSPSELVAHVDRLAINTSTGGVTFASGDFFEGNAAAWNSETTLFRMNGTVTDVPGGGGADSVTPDGLEASSEVGAPAIGQVHALTGTGLEATSEVGTPTVGQTNVLTAVGLEVVSEVGAPPVGQVHALIANGIEAASAVGNPTAASVNAVHVIEFAWHHSGTNDDDSIGNANPLPDRDARNWYADMSAADSDVTYSASGDFIFTHTIDALPPGDEDPERATTYAIPDWNALRDVNEWYLQPDNYESVNRAPDATGGVPADNGEDNYVQAFTDAVDAWELNAPPAATRRYSIIPYLFDAGTFFDPDTATTQQINDWIAACLDETPGGYARWTDDFRDLVQAARPGLTIGLCDVNRWWISTYQNTALGNVPIRSLFWDDAPHGEANSYLIVGLIMYIYETGRKPHASYAPPARIHSEIRDNWPEIVDHVYSEIALAGSSATDIEVASEVGAPAVGQIHAVTAESVAAGSELGVPSVGQIHALSPAALASASEVGVPAVGQVHALIATGLASTSDVGAPAITIEGLLSPLDLVATSQIGTPAIGQIHSLVTNGIEASFEFTLPAFSGQPFTPIFIDAARTKRTGRILDIPSDGRVSTYEV